MRPRRDAAEYELEKMQSQTNLQASMRPRRDAAEYMQVSGTWCLETARFNEAAA